MRPDSTVVEGTAANSDLEPQIHTTGVAEYDFHEAFATTRARRDQYSCLHPLPTATTHDKGADQ